MKIRAIVPPAMVTALAVSGLFLSLYSLHVQRQIQTKMGYKPALDISRRISCTKVFKSPYSHLLSLSGLVQAHTPLDVSNAHVATLFYMFMATYPFGRVMNSSVYFLVAGAFSACMIYLCYIIYAVFGVCCPTLVIALLVNCLMIATMTVVEWMPWMKEHKRSGPSAESSEREGRKEGPRPDPHLQKKET